MATGCGYLRAEWARGNAEIQQLDAYAIPKPIAEVWVRATLPSGAGEAMFWKSQGWTWTETEPYKMRTATKASKEKGAGGDTRDVLTWFESEGVAVPAGTQVRFVEWTETTTFREGKTIGTQKSSRRRTDMDLALVRHFDPAAAARIEAAGEQAAQSTK